MRHQQGFKHNYVQDTHSHAHMHACTRVHTHTTHTHTHTRTNTHTVQTSYVNLHIVTTLVRNVVIYCQPGAMQLWCWQPSHVRECEHDDWRDGQHLDGCSASCLAKCAGKHAGWPRGFTFRHSQDYIFVACGVALNLLNYALHFEVWWWKQTRQAVL